MEVSRRPLDIELRAKEIPQLFPRDRDLSTTVDAQPAQGAQEQTEDAVLQERLIVTVRGN